MQAEAALTASEAAHAQAQSDADRYESLLKSNAVSRQEYERTATAVKSTAAELRRAREAINEMQATLDFATIRSPMEGIVVDKKVDVGDLVTPGQTLATLLDPNRMQLVASVRESLAHRLQTGQNIDVQIEALNKQCTGTVSEIVPEAQSASRTFQVKVTGPCPQGVYSGMFGATSDSARRGASACCPARGRHERGAARARRRGRERPREPTRAIRSGRTLDDNVEVLSGLREGEQVELPAVPTAKHEATHG